MTPIQLLEKHLKSLQRDLSKSIELYTDGKIGKKLHDDHVKNISPKINQYCEAIEKLKKE